MDGKTKLTEDEYSTVIKTRPEGTTGIDQLSSTFPEKPRYDFIREIAEGGMGKITLLWDSDLKREVIKKSVLLKFSIHQKAIEMFISEAQHVARLEHPNIIPIYDFGAEEKGGFYFTMKYIKGVTLKSIIHSLSEGCEKTHAEFGWNRRVRIIQQICDALQFAHEKKVIHRDLKPDNIMIGEFGEVVVMDWGLAKTVEDIESGGSNNMGTPAYMSPEQISDPQSVGSSSDLYTTGLILYELLTLSKAHGKTEGSNIYNAVLNETPKSFDEVKSPVLMKVPIELEYITFDTLKKIPQERFSSARALNDALQLYIDGKYPVRCPHTALKSGIMKFGRTVDEHPKVVIIGLILLIAGLVILIAI